MKRILLLLLFAAGWSLSIPGHASAAPTPATLDFSLHFGFFYNSLHPHGEWIELDDGVFVWRPHRVRQGWRPYMFGRWAWTDYGWYWVSREPFGWVTYHYGRWYFDDYYGWVWVPDDVWGPSWVEFRYDNDYVGWAPLPPYAGFHISFGLRFTRDWIAPLHYWNVVRVGYFGNEIRYRDVQSQAYARRLIGSSRTERNYEYRDQRVINRGIDPSFFERRGNRRVSRVEVIDRPGQTGEQYVRGGSRRTDRIEVYRAKPAELQSAPARVDARRGDRRTTMDLGSIPRQRDPGVSEPSRTAPSQSPPTQRRPGVQRTPETAPTPSTPPQTVPDQRRSRIQRQQEQVQPTPAPGQVREPVRGRQRQTPGVEKKTEQLPQQERRRELIQRNEQRAPSTPANREPARIRQEQQSSREAGSQHQRSVPERSGDRRRK